MGNAKEKILRDVKVGLYQVLILKLLLRHGPLHGYAIRKMIIDTSNGILNPSESTVYDSLKRLEKLGLIESFWAENPGGPMRKYYRIKEESRGLVEEILREIVILLDIVSR